MNFIDRLGRKIASHSSIKPEDVALNVACSEFEVNNWAISDFIVNNLVPITGTHPYPITELNLMVAAVCRLKPQQVFEWGTNIGKSARIFHDTSKFFHIPLHVHSIDLPDDIEHNEHPKSNRGYMVKGLQDVTMYQGDGVVKTIELYQKNSALPTLVFIDGDHSYDSVLRELDSVTQHMPTANVLLHDTFYQSENSRYNVGPYDAIANTLKAHPGKYKVMSTTTGLPGMTLLYQL